jgi:hypothetical protein
MSRTRYAAEGVCLLPPGGEGWDGGYCVQYAVALLALAGRPQHGLALGTTVQYPPSLRCLCRPQAVQGGVLTLSVWQL